MNHDPMYAQSFECLLSGWIRKNIKIDTSTLTPSHYQTINTLTGDFFCFIQWRQYYQIKSKLKSFIDKHYIPNPADNTSTAMSTIISLLSTLCIQNKDIHDDMNGIIHYINQIKKKRATTTKTIKLV